MRSRPLLVAAVFYFLLSLVCARIPLLNYLGFEFSLIIALAVSVLEGPVMVGMLQGMLPKTGSIDPSRMVIAFRSAFLWSLAILGIPLIVMLANGLFVRNCAILEGVAFFVLLPGVTTWFASCLSLFCTVHYRHPLLVYYTVMAVSVAYAGALGYFTPAIFSYNFFYGYFPGFTYDELIEITGTLMLFRGLTVVAGAILLFCGVLVVGSSPMEAPTFSKGLRLLRDLFARPRLWGVIGAIVGFALLWLLRGQLGFESSASFISNELGSSKETEHFTIYYPTGKYSLEEIEWVASEHEFRLAQLLQSVKVSLDDKIESYIYPSDETKLRYIGAGTTNIAKPWSSEIHLSAGAMSSALKHELAHVAVAPFGIPILRTSLHPGLTEGLAMAIEWDWGNRTLHEYSAMIRRSGLEPDMESIMSSPGFATQSSSVSYVVAGSFCRFLIDGWGISAMAASYRIGTFESVYGKDLPKLINEWHELLDSIPERPGDRDITNVYFRRPSIFLKTCPRSLARMMKKARLEFSNGDFPSAAATYRSAVEDGGGVDAVHGIITSSVRAGDPEDPIAIYDSVILRNEIPTRFLPSFLSVGDAFWMKGETEKARELYSRIVASDFSDVYREGAAIRLLALQDDPDFIHFFVSGEADSIRGKWIDSVANAHPERPLPRFIRGRLYYRSGEFRRAVDELSKTDLSSVDAFLECVRLRTGGIALLRLGEVDQARLWFREILAHPLSDFRMLETLDWLERCDWMEGTNPLALGPGRGG